MPAFTTLKISQILKKGADLKCFVHVTYGNGSVIFWEASRYVMYFRFMDDVMFAKSLMDKKRRRHTYIQSDSI